MNRPVLEIADLVRAAGDGFIERSHRWIRWKHVKVLLAIARCRTAALGGHFDECTGCGHRTAISYNSCRDRHCPKCQTAARDRWIAARRKELLPTRYVHVVFTLPRHLAPLVLQNKKVIYDLLFRTSAETLLEVARNPQHLGAEIGFFSVLHSWSQKLETHPHVHCVVPAGGLSPDHTHWVSASERFGLPFSIYDSAAGTLFGPATTFTTGSLAPGATLESSSRSGSVSSRVNEFFNTSAFVPAPLIPNGGLIDGIYPVSGSRGTIFGNLGRNILRGPDQRVGDIAVIKNTPLTEHVKLAFRWEVFNVLNRPNFANPSSDVSTPGTFGVISALTVNPRIMQYALKLEF